MGIMCEGKFRATQVMLLVLVDVVINMSLRI
jgi:hypothetical protein